MSTAQQAINFYSSFPSAKISPVLENLIYIKNTQIFVEKINDEVAKVDVRKYALPKGQFYLYQGEKPEVMRAKLKNVLNN